MRKVYWKYRVTLIGMILIAAACAGRGEETSPIVASDSGAVAPQQGMQEIMAEDGTLRMKGELRDGKRNGPWSSFFPNGSIRSRAVFVDGLQEGATEVFYDNGMTYYKGQYHRDRPVGEWVFFDPAGTLMKTVRYDSLGTIIEQR
jgi:antitoxin component YwqK of YwqJK toxin-antitoxin module